ncbi:MAG: phospholipase C type enzyme [Heterodermia speciosa]|uniref:Phospholipase C type enzyme n=1 Tax=Heterodermia speciosa TaxID=116794 RepID=A0A8H3I8F3_9LECA|nr:MAG: phospholipase C type enzyme [Heterodermia speciosa]
MAPALPSNGASQSSEVTSLNILTLNCWGLKFISKFRNQRLEEIGRRLASASPTPEIVGLQECWTQRDYLQIRDLTRTILPYGKFYHSGIFGGGLAILSKFPIVDSNMVRYPLNGRPTAFFRGDWFVGKGVACATIELAPGRRGDIVEVFCTHLHAPYEREPNDSYLCHRTAQAWEVAKLMRGAAEKGRAVIGLGDFNMVPLSFAHQLITAHAPVQDVWRVLHPDSSLGSANHPPERARGKEIPNARFNIEKNGTTCDSALNTWRWSKQVQKRLFNGESIIVEDGTPDPRAKRLDYIFFSNGLKVPDSTPIWKVHSVKVGMTDPHSSIGCSLSDHFSVEATLSRPNAILITDKPTSTSSPKNPDPFPPIDTETPTPLPPSTYSQILSLIATYTTRERHQRLLRLSHFGLSVLVSIGCFIAIWYSPRPFVSFLLLLLSTLGFGAGVVDGLIGGLFVGSELRALKEFEWEVRNARDVAEERERLGGGDGDGVVGGRRRGDREGGLRGEDEKSN